MGSGDHEQNRRRWMNRRRLKRPKMLKVKY